MKNVKDRIPLSKARFQDHKQRKCKEKLRSHLRVFVLLWQPKMEETRASGSAQEMVIITMHRINEKYQSVNERLLVLREGHSLLGTFPPLMVNDHSNLVDNKDE